jgi:uncharacterized protein
MKPKRKKTDFKTAADAAESGYLKVRPPELAAVLAEPPLAADAPVSLSVMTTYSCQLACAYCRVRQRPLNISSPELKDSIDFLLRSRSRNIELKFFGGEPLLRPDIIREGTEYCAARIKKGRNCRYMLVTNGILLEGEMLRWLKRKKFHVMISVDGSATAHAAQRPSLSGETFHERILRNARALAESGIPYITNVITTPERAGFLFGELDYLARNGITHIQAAYDVSTVWNEAALDKFMNGCLKFRAAARQGKYGPDFPELRNFINNAEPVSLKTDLIADCDGKIYRDGALFLEKILPRARSMFYLGEAKTLANPEAVAVSPLEHLKLWLDVCNTPQSRKMFLSTIAAGLRLRRFYKTLGS